MANVAVWGLRDRQLQVLVDPVRLRRHGVTLDRSSRPPATRCGLAADLRGGVDPRHRRLHRHANQRIAIQHTSRSGPRRTSPRSPSRRRAASGCGWATWPRWSRTTSCYRRRAREGRAGPDDGGGEAPRPTRCRSPGTSRPRSARWGPACAASRWTPRLPAGRLPRHRRDNLGRSLPRPAAAGPGARRCASGWWRAALIAPGGRPVSLAVAWLVLSSSGAALDLMVLAGLGTHVSRSPTRSATSGTSRAGSATDDRRQDGRAGHLPRPRWRCAGRSAYATVRPGRGRAGAGAAGRSPGVLPPAGARLHRGVLASTVVALTFIPALSLVLLATPPWRQSPLPRLGTATRGRCGGVGRPPAIAYGRPSWSLAGLCGPVPAAGHQTVAPPLQDRNLLISWEPRPAPPAEMTRITEQVSRDLQALRAYGRRRAPGPGHHVRPGGERQLRRAVGRHRSGRRLRRHPPPSPRW